jgi:hypothetical protein
MQVLPARLAAAGNAVGEDPLADRPETAELLRVDVDELARTLRGCPTFCVSGQSVFEVDFE